MDVRYFTSLISDAPASKTEGGFWYAIEVNILLTDQGLTPSLY